MRVSLHETPWAKIARRLVDRLAARPDVRLWFGTGAKDSSAMLGRIDETKGLLAVYTTGTLEARFAYLKAIPPFDDSDRLQALIDELVAIPGVSFTPGRFDWPACPLLGLAADESFERFVRAFERALDEMRG